MKLITRDTDYAIRALIFIAQSKKNIVSVADLVGALAIPRPFLRKILQILNRNGLLKSYKGKGGGFKLAKPATNITLIEIMEIFQGPFELNQHLLKRKTCPRVDTCELKKKIDSLEKKMHKELSEINIAILIPRDKRF